jgi:AcrR family transcriptional regulator
VSARATGLTDVSTLNDEQKVRRQRIIDAAFELGAERGYDAVQMRDVAATANVSLATIYRYFSSKDHVFAAAMNEWTARLHTRVATSPPKGDTMAERLIDVLLRACSALERQPKLGMALVRSLSAVDVDTRESTLEVRRQISSMGEQVLAPLDPETREDIISVMSHVWYSSLTSWAVGRTDFDVVTSELTRAVHVLVDPYERP